MLNVQDAELGHKEEEQDGAYRWSSLDGKRATTSLSLNTSRNGGGVKPINNETDSLKLTFDLSDPMFATILAKPEAFELHVVAGWLFDHDFAFGNIKNFSYSEVNMGADWTNAADDMLKLRGLKSEPVSMLTMSSLSSYVDQSDYLIKYPKDPTDEELMQIKIVEQERINSGMETIDVGDMGGPTLSGTGVSHPARCKIASAA